MAGIATRGDRNSVFVGAFIDPSVKEGVEELARLNDRSFSAELRLALRRHLEAAGATELLVH